MIFKAIVASLVALGVATPVTSMASESWKGQAETPHYKGMFSLRGKTGRITML